VVNKVAYAVDLDGDAKAKVEDPLGAVVARVEEEEDVAAAGVGPGPDRGGRAHRAVGGSAG
jgi:hypothetical protein